MNKSHYKKGFTLIEIIVSLSIFTIVAVIAVGALLKVVDANKKSQTLKTSINNINFVLDTMSREIRTGNNYYCQSGSSFVMNSSSAYLPTSNPGNSGMYLLNPTLTSAQRSCNLSTPWTIVFNSAKTAPRTGGGTCKLHQAYMFDGTTIKSAEQPSGCGETLGLGTGATSFQPLLSPDIVLEEAHISVETGDSATIGQPRVFLHLKGYSGVKDRTRTSFDIQTSISQRIND